MNKFRKSNIYYLVIVLALLFPVPSQGQVFFNRDFAPQEGLIKKVEKPLRDEICLNGNWQFMPVELSKQVSLEEIKSPLLPTTSGWEETPIKVPSPWNVNGFTNGEGGDFRSYPSYPNSWNEVKSGWLRKVMEIPSDWSGNRIILHFEAVAGYAKVFINGKAVGDHFDSFLPFDLDITNFVEPGENTEVLVWVAHGSLLNDPGKYGRRNYVAGSFWGIYIAGIWQDVYIQKFPEVYVSDSYVKPWVDRNELEVEVTVKNTSGKTVKFNLEANIHRWINKNGKSVLDIPEMNWTLGEKCLSFSEDKLLIEPNSSRTFILKTKVNASMDLWSPQSPVLYGLLLSLESRNQVLDTDYTRFGWRQFDIQGTQLLLNGEPIQIKGDSWHFMGVPQMTRRYAYAWYQMLLDANANGLRLHAQVFPRFYLEMADEMGICVLDETGIWSSDGGPKIDSEIYWEACRSHVKGMILRDRNHPSVLGWSVCNETLPVTKHVFNAPGELVEKNILEINKWVAIAKETDPTRTWISGDGETQAETDLPTVIGHYGGSDALESWSGKGKPWGIGETGMAYYGTPAQIAKINGDRAYESQLGRMEGLAGEAFDLISMQRKHNASYTSIFNIVWYGLKPLELGLRDVSRAAELSDGIFFKDYIEGKPGYQPERLGPYTSTLNPGYDPTLALYETWPLFDAVKAAFSENYIQMENSWNFLKDNTVKTEKAEEKSSIVLLSEKTDSDLKRQFENLAVKFEPLSLVQNQLVIVDGENPPVLNSKAVVELQRAIQNGTTVLFWHAGFDSKNLIESLSGSNVEFFNREATSYIIKNNHAIVRGESNASYYFSELTKKPVSTLSVGGDWVDKSQVILEACNTDWLKWNYQGEAIKTAKVYKSEREAKAGGIVIVSQSFGRGEIIVSTIDLFSLGNQSKQKLKGIISNLGGEFKGQVSNIPEALNKDMVLENALFLGSYQLESEDTSKIFMIESLADEDFVKVKSGTLSKGKYWDIVSSGPNGVFDYMKMNIKRKDFAIVYLSFWMYSPRSLTDLLVEPDMPRLDMHFGVDDALALNINGKVIKEFIREGAYIEDQFTFEGIPLEKGWNHILIKVVQGSGDWLSRVRFSSTKPEFMKEIKTVVDR